MSKTINLGRVTAYADAVAAGYTGTREQFANDLANAANYAAEAGDAAETATEAATTASTAAETATDKAEEASADAEQAHADAQAILGAKETAVVAAATATSKAGEAANSAQQAAASETAAAGSATTASNAATSATASKNAAATSETNAANSASQAAQTLTNVNQAGATQVAAIQAKGTEVLNSIPADYTELSNDVDGLKSDLSSAVDEIENYPAKTKTISLTSSDFVQGYRHNQPGATVKNDSGYTTTKNAIHFRMGDRFACPTDQGIAYFFVNTNGTFYLTYPPTGYVFTEDVTLYIDCGKSGITPETTPTVQYTTATIIESIVAKDELLQTQINSLKTHFPSLEVCFKQGDANVLRGYKLSNGKMVTTSANYLCCTSDFISCSTGDVFLIIGCHDVARYTSNSEGSYTTTTELANLPLYSGNDRWNAWVADFDGYVRFTLYWNDPVECAVTRLNLSDYPYTCVCLGDSIFGNNQKPNDLPTYMQRVDNLMTANCGFGGTMAATHYNSKYTPLSFWSIADAINSGDWSGIDIDWNALYGDHVFMANVYILCHLIDWTKVRIVTVAYGTNDWNGDVTIDNENNPKDVTTFKGALRYGIEKIQTAYPEINIIMLSPLYRYWSNSADYSTVDDDSDNRVNGGRKLTEYVVAMKEVAEEYHLPYYDNYNTAGINKLTAPSILRDGTHLNYKYGVSMVGKHLGAEIALSNQGIGDDY